ncbi:MAG TPA: hypothetical protein VFO48_07920 [Vicinamibacterales bacterium]|nr:hypothetical protein [Vicinamibacterales bacterium]
MLNFVGMVSRNLAAERALDLVRRSRRLDRQQLTEVSLGALGLLTLLLELGHVRSRQFLAILLLDLLVRAFGFGRPRAVRAVIPYGL